MTQSPKKLYNRKWYLKLLTSLPFVLEDRPPEERLNALIPPALHVPVCIACLFASNSNRASYSVRSFFLSGPQASSFKNECFPENIILSEMSDTKGQMLRDCTY